jgi:predicted dehydrogenase
MSATAVSGPIRMGVIGVGNMGIHHLGYMNQVEGAMLAAACDVDPKRLELARERVPGVPVFSHYRDLFDSNLVDAILIATPHYPHPDIMLEAFDREIHVLCEKPVAVTVGRARKMNQAAARKPHLKFGAMFMMRTAGMFSKIREIVASGELGQITRLTWIATDWFRSWAYYASGGWRATWDGEGGGVLLNQCPHNLDQICWILGGMMPNRVTAVAHIGKTHPIEVEDEVSAILEYPNGAIGHFTTTTGEAPGSNRLEIAGDRGNLIMDRGKLLLRRTATTVSEYNRTTRERFKPPQVTEEQVAVPADPPDQHRAITQNFVNAILKDEPLIAPGVEGIRGLELGNAMLMSGIQRRPVELPLDAEEYERFLEELTAKYSGRKTLQAHGQEAVVDMSSSFKT